MTFDSVKYSTMIRVMNMAVASHCHHRNSCDVWRS